MDDAGLVRRIQCLAELTNKGGGPLEFKTLVFHDCPQTYAFDVLHDEERRAVRHLTSVEDPNDTRMIDPRKRFNLLFEFVDSPFTSKRFFMQQFDHDGLAKQLLVVSQIHGTKAS